jgi:hypothetical protein
MAGDGKYTTKSAYEAQFLGSYPDFEWEHLWKAQTENKCKFHSWLLIQNKLWNADRLIKYGANANPVCQLCRSQPEPILHMVAKCSYSRSVWRILSSWLGTDLQDIPAARFQRLQAWWRGMLASGNNGNQDLEHAQARLQKLIYIVWHIWKERCRGVFDNKAVQPEALANSIKLDVQQWCVAWNRGTASFGTALGQGIS